MEVTLEDFENMTDEDMEAAIRDSAKGFEVKCMAKGMTFYCCMPSKRIYMLPLNITVEQMGEFQEIEDADIPSGLRRVFRHAHNVGLDGLEKESFTSVLAMTKRYGDVMARVQGAALGE